MGSSADTMHSRSCARRLSTTRYVRSTAHNRRLRATNSTHAGNPAPALKVLRKSALNGIIRIPKSTTTTAIRLYCTGTPDPSALSTARRRPSFIAANETGHGTAATKRRRPDTQAYTTTSECAHRPTRKIYVHTAMLTQAPCRANCRSTKGMWLPILAMAIGIQSSPTLHHPHPRPQRNHTHDFATKAAAGKRRRASTTSPQRASGDIMRQIYKPYTEKDAAINRRNANTHSHQGHRGQARDTHDPRAPNNINHEPQDLPSV